jgi:lipopolysaccharide transport system permease protein
MRISSLFISPNNGAAPAEASPISQNQRVPLARIRPPSRWTSLGLHEIVEFRDLLGSLAMRDIKLRYKQTLLGVAWVILQPVLAAGIFTFVFGLIAKLPSDGVPYFLFSFAGLLGWNLFSNILTRASGCLVTNANLISKVFFPRLVLPFSCLGSSFVDFGVSVGMMALLMLGYRFAPGAAIFLLPVWLLLLAAAGLGLGLWTAALSVSYRDVQYVLPVIVQCLLLASPIPYGASAVPKKLLTFYYLNPLTAPLEACRWSLLGTAPPPMKWLIYSGTLSVGLLVFSLVAFKRMERKFADVI